AEAERVLRTCLEENIYDYAVGKVAYHMAGKDPDRAVRLLDLTEKDHVYERAYSLAATAAALADNDGTKARAMRADAFAILKTHVDTGRDYFNSRETAASCAASMLPFVERVDPSLVQEHFWRAMSLRTGHRGMGPNDDHESLADSFLALFLSRYDRSVAAV